MSEFLQQLLNGLSLGAIYALIALGYTMVYGVLRFINFAHADVFMVGAYVGYFAGRHFPSGTLSGGLAVLAVVMLMSYPWEFLSIVSVIYLALIPVSVRSYRQHRAADAHLAAAVEPPAAR